MTALSSVAGRKSAVLRRIVNKDGHNNVRIDNVEGMVKLYLHDIWTTAVDMKWRYKLTLFASTFIMTWFIFGVIFYFIGMGNGDFEPGLSSNHTPCVLNVETLTVVFLFSLESQTAIGYGFRCISEECPLAIFTPVAQLVITGLAEIFVTGAFLVKLARPKKRAETIKFSQSAVVCRRRGQLCLMLRVSNVTEEESSVDFHMDSSGESPFLILPLTFYHILDERSPLSGLTAENLLTRDFELLVTLNAAMESTAATCQSCTSYVLQELLTPSGRYVANFKFFDKVQASNDPAFVSNNTEKLKLEDYKKE
uniref:Potassium inwardly rectifying channel subfamily J member 15 n=1 Tax=Salarias fasciatus TaxID=181472 RepID=A0A672H555_SALFA